ncbi:MAG: hypothetical protein GY909_09595 [Oligoflexia bacterium]|nr:hypothetical protein [Oligoflexia bacterium]
MKKLVFTVLGLLMASEAYSMCTVVLENRRTGIEKQRFTSIGLRACTEALDDCERARLYTRRPGMNVCRIKSQTDVPPRRNACTYSILEFGRVVDSFEGRGRFACDDARRMCSDALYRGQRTGRYRYFAECKKTETRLPPRRDLVTRQCQVNRVDRFGNLMGVHLGTATGRRGTGVNERACQDAEAQCRAQRYYSERCERVLGNPVPRPTPRPPVIRRR